MVEILKSFYGRRFGLDDTGALVLNKDGVQNLLGKYSTAVVTTAQVLALNATAVSVLAAPGAGLAIIPRVVAIHKPAGAAYAAIAGGEDLVLKYTDASGAQISSVIEATGFLDQTTAETRVAGMLGDTGASPASYEPMNAAVVLHLLIGEVTTGDSDLHVRIWYDIIQTVFTA
jgi:hypothetical protein